jgi:hypothetical protein
MKHSTFKWLAIALLSTLAGTAHAQVFGPSTSATQDSNVYAGAGGTALAWDFSDQDYSTTTVVHGVTFSGIQNQGGVDFSYALPGAGHDVNGIATPDTAFAAAGGSANYAYILQDLKYTTNTSSLTFTGLTVGDSYELQIFAGGGATYPETFTDTKNSASGTLYYGDGYNTTRSAFIDETFTATTGGTETLDISGPGYFIVSAVNLQVIPEPSTYALMLGGLALVGFCVRRKLA